MAKELPPVSTEKLDELERKVFIQNLLTPPLLYIAIGLLVILIVGGAGGAYWFSSNNAPTPTPIAITTPTQESTSTPTAENITPELTLEPPPTLNLPPSPLPSTPEPTSPPSVAPPASPTLEVTEITFSPTPETIAASPTLEATVESTPVPTVEPTAVLPPTSQPTNEPVSSSTIDPTSLTGKIAIPIFNPQTNTYDLYIASAPDWQLSSQPFQKAASQPAFSPDGTQIIFRSWGGPSTSYSEQLIIRPIAGTTERFITNHPEDARPHWANFDFPIVFHSRPSGGSAHIYFQALWESAPQDAKSRRESVVGENPTWLPDGRIVYFSGEPSGNGLYVMMADDPNSRRLIWGTNSTIAPKGDPINNRVVLSSKDDDLYLLNITDGASSPDPLLITPGERERLPNWSPNGQFIVYVKDHTDENWAIYVIRADGTGETKLFDLPGSIDGKPANVPGGALGWYEEQLAWGW